MKHPNNSQPSSMEFYDLMSGLLSAINTKPNTISEYLQLLYKKPIPTDLKQGLTAKIHAVYNEWVKSGGFNAQSFAEALMYILTDKDLIEGAYDSRDKIAIESYTESVEIPGQGPYTDDQSLLKQIAYYKRVNATLEHNNARKLQRMAEMGVNTNAVNAVYTELISSKSGNLNIENVKKILKLHKNKHFEFEVLKSLSKFSGNPIDAQRDSYALSSQLKSDLTDIRAFQKAYLPLIKNFIRETQKMIDTETQVQMTVEDLKKSPLYKLCESHKDEEIDYDMAMVTASLIQYVKKRYVKILSNLIKDKLKALTEKAINDMGQNIKCKFFDI